MNRFDVAFDVLCYLSARGRSRPHVLDQLGASVQSLDVHAFRSNLESLGHLEIERDPTTLQTTDWEVSTSCLAGVEDDYLLCGWRSLSLVEVLRVAVVQAGGRLLEQPQESAPTAFRVADLEEEQIEVMAASISDACGIKVGVAHRAGPTLAERLPSLSELIEASPHTQLVGARALRRWAPSEARWLPVSHPSSVGAFALDLPGGRSRYIWRDEQDLDRGTMRVGDAPLVKHIGSLLAGEPLLGFEDDGQTLYAPLGAELPGLYGRAACLTAGRLPEKQVGGGRPARVAYNGIPRNVAERLAWLLTT